MASKTEDKLVNMPPHDIDAEEALNGSILIYGESLVDVVEIVKPDDFYSEQNRYIFAAMMVMWKRGASIDSVTLASELERKKALELIGGGGYLSHLISVVPTSLDVVHYAHIVSTLAGYRRMLLASDKIARLAYKADPDLAKSITMAQKLLMETTRYQDEGLVGPRKTADHIMDYLKSIGEKAPGISWMFKSLDASVGRLQPGDYVLIGARPSVGKTQLMLEVALRMAKFGFNVLFASAEMLESGILQRTVSIEAGIHLKKIRQGFLSSDEIGKASTTAAMISELPIHFLYGRRTSASIYNVASRMKKGMGLDVVFVDYAQKLRDCHEREFGNNGNERVSYVSSTLDLIAKDLEVPIVVASQLNRESERRPGKWPQLSDLRDSGALEQDADIVMLLHREENEETKSLRNTLIIKPAKIRQGGEAMVVELLFNGICYKDVSPK